MPRLVRWSIGLVSVICLAVTSALIAAGCGTAVNPARLVDKRLLYLGQDGKRAVVVDTVTSGKPLLLGGPLAAVFASVAPFTEVSLLNVNGQYTIAPLFPPPYLIAPVVEAADSAAAVATYPSALLDWLCFSGDRFAITDYRLIDSELVGGSGQRLDIQFTVDVKPLRDPFRLYAGSSWADPGTDGWLRNQTMTIRVYRAGNSFCLYHPEGAVFMFGPPEHSVVHPEPRYRSVTTGNPSEVWAVGGTCETVLYEDIAFSYLVSLRLTVDERSFTAEISRVPAAGGRPVTIAPLPRGTWSAEAYALQGDWLYLTTRTAAPFSETRSGEVGRVNLTSGTYETLLPDRAHVLGMVGTTAYLIRTEYEGEPAGGIYALDTLDGTLSRICPLPQADDYGPGTAAQLISFGSGTLTVAWLAEEGYDSIPYPIFTINATTGAIIRIR